MLRIGSLCIFLMLSAAAFGQNGAVEGFCTQGGVLAKTQGLSSTNQLQGVIPSCLVTVYYTGTTTQVPGSQIYSNAGGTVLGNPFKANALGSTNPGRWIFWAATGSALDVQGSGGICPNCYSTSTPLATDVFPASGGTAALTGAAFTGPVSAPSLTLGTSLTVPNGGTGATTAAAALANLGGAALTGAAFTGPISGTSASFSGTVSAGTAVSASVFNGTLWGQSLNNAPTSYYAYGDSITAGDYANGGTSCAPVGGVNPCLIEGYVGLIASDLGLLGVVNSSILETNFGTGGATAESVNAIQIFGNGAGYAHENPGIISPLHTLMVGTNDVLNWSSGFTVPNFQLFHLAALSWLSIPSNYKIFGQSCTQTGTWTNGSTYLTGVEIDSQTNGSTLSCPITSYGGMLYVWYTVSNTSSGTFTYRLDSGSPVSVNAYTTPAIPAGQPVTGSVAFIRIPTSDSGSASYSHTVTFTVTSSTGSGNSVGILGVGTPSPIHYWNGPVVYSAGVPLQYNNQNATLVTNLNAASLADQQLLHNDGLPVFFVDIQKCVGSSSTYVTNADGVGVHWTAVGHIAGEQCFDSVMQPQRGWNVLREQWGGELNGIQAKIPGYLPRFRMQWNDPNGSYAGSYGVANLSMNYSYLNAAADDPRFGVGALNFNMYTGAVCLATGPNGGVAPTCNLNVNSAGVIGFPHYASAAQSFTCFDTAGNVLLSSSPCVSQLNVNNTWTNRQTFNSGIVLGASYGATSVLTMANFGLGTLTYTAITAGGCQDQQLSIPNTFVGQVCFASPQGDPGAGMSYGGCRPTGSGQTMVRVCSALGGTPAALTWVGWAMN